MNKMDPNECNEWVHRVFVKAMTMIRDEVLLLPGDEQDKFLLSSRVFNRMYVEYYKINIFPCLENRTRNDPAN